MKLKFVFLTMTIAFFGSAVLVLIVFMAMIIVEPQSEKDIQNRISQYELVKEEQQLITDILTLKYEAAVIQSKFQPAPPPTRTVIESEKE